MGRRKLEMKLIKDKSSRQVAFSKRRAGLLKKARELSVLCDIDVAVVVFSGRGKLFEFCHGSSMEQILKKYEESSLEPVATGPTGACETQEKQSQCEYFRTSGELLEMVQRHVEESCLEKLNVPDLVQLEEDLYASLMQITLRKNQLMMEYVKSLHEKETLIREENICMQRKVAEMKNETSTEKVAGLNVFAADQMNRGPKLVTLPLFME